jgi:hypothetical protein
MLSTKAFKKLGLKDKSFEAPIGLPSESIYYLLLNTSIGLPLSRKFI